MQIGNRIKALRIEFEYTQKVLAEKIGLTPKMISFYENGERIPPMDIVLKFVEIFDVSSDYLLGLTDKRRPDEDLEWRYPPVSNRLGNILKEYREQNNLSIKEFAEKIEINVNTYSDIETGKTGGKYKLSPKMVKNMSDVTGYAPDYILGATDHTSIPSNETINIGGNVFPTSRIESNFYFKAKFEELCLANNIFADNAYETLGLTKQEFIDVRWNRMPTLLELLKISYASGVSMDYLIGKTDVRMSTLDADELELILDYRDCSPTYKSNIMKRAHELSLSSLNENLNSSVAADELLKTGTDNPK